ncbi:MAG: hypothetical protein ABIG28_00670 [archaeon]
MFSTIIKNMEDARDAGDLYQGSVTIPLPEKKKVIPFSSQTEKEKFKIFEEPIMSVPEEEKETPLTPEKEIFPQQKYEEHQEDLTTEALISQESGKIAF